MKYIIAKFKSRNGGPQVVEFAIYTVGMYEYLISVLKQEHFTDVIFSTLDCI